MMTEYDKHIPDEELAIYVREIEEEIEFLEEQISDIKEAAGYLPYDCESLINIIKSHRIISDGITRRKPEETDD
jgi:hypothetical protein